MMKKAAVLVVIGLLVGAGLFADTIGNTNKDVKLIASPILSNILTGIKQNNVPIFRKDFSTDMNGSFSQIQSSATIKTLNSQLGNCKSTEYLGFLNVSGMTKTLWKAKYDKTGSDILIMVIISKTNGKYLVTGLWFQ